MMIKLLLFVMMMTMMTLVVVESSHYKFDTSIPRYSTDPLVQFMFLEGGSLSLAINSQPQDHKLYFTFCTDDDWKNLYGYRIVSPTCDILENEGWQDKCDIVVNFTDTLSVYRQVTRYNRYILNILSCQDIVAPVNMSIDLKMVNPDNNNLSAEMIPAPLMYTAIGIVWIGVLSGWLYNAVINCHSLARIHYPLTLYPILKIIICLYSRHIMTQIADGNALPVQYFIFHVLDILFQLFFQIILLLLGTGWSITQQTIKGDRYNILALIGGLAVSMILEDLYVTDSISYLFVELFILSIRVFLLFYVFVAININSRQLEYRIHQYNPSQETQASLTQDQIVLIIKKFKLFVMLKLILLFWVGLLTFKFFTSLLLYGGTITNWVSIMNSEVLDLILFVCIAYNYRPRQENIFRVVSFRSVGDDDDDHQSTQHPNNNTNNTNNNTSNNQSDNDDDDEDGIEMNDL